MIREIQGDLLNAKADVICHQVNCKGVMGAGLARKIRNKFPLIVGPYKAACYVSGEHLLGTVQYFHTPVYAIANLFAQDDYGSGKCHTDYDALKSCFRRLAIAWPDGVIAVPYNLGCGLAGGDWNKVYALLKEVFEVPDFRGTLLICKL